MAHVTNHSPPPLSASSLVACQQHSMVLHIASLNNEQNPSITASCAAASLGPRPNTLKEPEAREVFQGLSIPTAPVSVEARGEGAGDRSWRPQRKECQDGMQMQIQPAYQRSLRCGRARAQGGYMQGVDGEPGPESVSFRKNLPMRVGRNSTNVVSGGVKIPNLQRPFTPPVRPRTSSLSGTLLRPVSEGSVNLTPGMDRPTMYRSLSSSEPFLDSCAFPSRRGVQPNPSNLFSSSQEDIDFVARLHNARHSSESLSCLGLSLAEKRTISRGIEKEEARATVRAEERRRAAGAKKFSSMVRSGPELCEAKVGTESRLLSGKSRYRKWDNWFPQNCTNDGTWPNRDELLDPIEVQAMGILVPLMEMKTNEVGKRDGFSGVECHEARVVLGAPKQVGITGTVKRRTLVGEAMEVNRPSLITGPNTAFNQQAPEPSWKTMSPRQPVKSESLRHKISETFLRCMGQLGLVELGCSPGTGAEIFQSGERSAIGVSSQPEENASYKLRSQWWARSYRRGTNNHQSSTIPLATESIKRVHPLYLHIGPISHKVAEKNPVLRPLLSVFRRKEADVLASPHESHRCTETQIAGVWNGCSWESEKFREAGKYIEPAIGDGELVLERDFSSASKSLRTDKISLTSLGPPTTEFKALPPRANISWTNILHEFAGALGDVKESGVRPITDHHKGSSDSLIPSIITNKSSLGRTLLASSNECLRTTEMEEYERFNELPSYIGSIDVSESGNRVGSEIDENRSGYAVHNDDTDNAEGGENCSDPESGCSSSGDEGSSADDDEDSKLRALLHQVGRTYVGYSTGRGVRSARKLASNERKEVEDTKRQNTYEAGLPRCVNREGLGKLSYSAGNARVGSMPIDSCVTLATKSALVHGNHTLASNENTKPFEENGLQTDYVGSGELARSM